jgi:hypothetical protein
MSFGYSVAGFFTVGSPWFKISSTLRGSTGSPLFKISSTLRESTGSSADYQELVLRIDCLEQLLNTVQSQIASSQLLISIVRAIIRHISNSNQLLRKFETITEKYKWSLSQCWSGAKWIVTWRKIGLGIYKRNEILELPWAADSNWRNKFVVVLLRSVS